MARRKKKELCFGGILVAAGCFIRTVQLICAFFGTSALSARWLYITMLCLLCGGFAVMAYEKKGKASFCAISAAAVSLLSTVMGNMSDGDDLLRILSALFLVLTFAFAGMCVIFSSRGNNRNILLGCTLVILALLCGVFAFGVGVSPVVTLLVLIAAYVVMGITVVL